MHRQDPNKLPERLKGTLRREYSAKYYCYSIEYTLLFFGTIDC